MTLSEEFLSLVQKALGDRPLAGEDLFRLESLGGKDWLDIHKTAREQSVSALVGQAALELPPSVEIADEAALGFAYDIERTSAANNLILRTAASLLERFRKEGLHPIVMKGPSVAAYYPRPELRTPGDIDLFFPGEEFHRAKAVIGEGKTHSASDGSFHFTENGLDVDVHSRYFDLHCPQRVLPEVPSPEATLLMLSSHILKHACGAGVGLRQICDMAMAYKALEGRYDPDSLQNLYKRTGILRWNALLSSFIDRRLGVKVPDFGVKGIPDGPLLGIIGSGGNFGNHAPGRQGALRASSLKRKAHTASRFVKRLPFSLRYSPKETMMTVMSLIKGNF